MLQKEREHDELDEDTCENKENECLPYLKNDVLSTAICFAGYTKCLKHILGFSLKNWLTLPILANKYFSNLRDEINEPIYTYNDEYMR